MKKVMHFLKSSYLIVIGIVIGATVLTVGALSIPTNIDNSVQTIKTIFISTNGIDTSGENVIVKIDNTSGAALTVRGNMTVGKNDNSVSGTWSSIAGGLGNAVTGDQSIIAGGNTNKINGNYSNIGGGFSNEIKGSNSLIVGGYDSSISGASSIVAGGYQNSITGDYSFVAGAQNSVIGNYNTVFGRYISGGTYDGSFVWSDGYVRSAATRYFTPGSSYSFIIRALNGVAIGTGATLGMTSLRVWDGTNGKVAAKEYCDQDGTGCVPASSLGGGGSSYWTQIGNDIYNNNSGGNGYVGIGTNAVTVPLQVKGSVIFGVVNSILGTMNPYSSILGGQYNNMYSPSYSLIGGGNLNDILQGASFSVIVGGYNNTIGTGASKSFIGGGDTNTIDNVAYGTIVGGSENVIGTNSTNSFIGGGSSNLISGFQAVRAFIGGGESNNVSASYGFVGGGFDNTVTSSYSAIGGGTGNIIATSEYSFIGGGKNNTMTNAYYSVIPGGRDNSINGVNSLYSFAAGHRAKANSAGMFVWADSTDADFSGNKSDSFIIRAGGGMGINTNNPDEALEVSGVIKSDASNNGLYLDDANSSYSGYLIKNSATALIISTKGRQKFVLTDSDNPYDNIISHGSYDSVILGGLYNTIGGLSNWSTIAGGYFNTITGASTYSIILGGYQNTISSGSYYSAAVGFKTDIKHSNVFMWNDGLPNFTSTATGQFLVHASNGVGINTNAPTEALDVNGNIRVRNIPQTTSANNVLAKDTNGELRWSLLTDLGISGGGTGYWTANGSNIYNSNAGNVGIGTTNPSDKLTLSGGNLLVNNGGIIAKDSVASNGILGFIVSSVTGTQTYPGDALIYSFKGFFAPNSIKFITDIASNPVMTLTSGGRVGIGTTTPTEKLEVDGNTKTNSLMLTGVGGAGGSIIRGTRAQNYPYINYSSSSLFIMGGYGGGGHPIYLMPNATDLTKGIVITTAGNVGIGVASPTGKLEVAGTVSVLGDLKLGVGDGRQQKTLTQNRAFVHDDWSALFGGTAGDVLGLNWAGDFEGGVLVGGSGVIVNGKIGIGVNNPTQKLEVAGNIYTNLDNKGLITDEGGNKRFGLMKYSGMGAALVANNVEVIKLGHVNVADVSAATSANFTPNLTIVAAGDATFSNSVTASAFYYSSDSRLKDNIELIQDPLQKLIQLNGYNFTWKKDGKKSVGVIAQEVEKFFPELVSTDNKGFKSVQYGNLVAPIIESIKSLYTKYLDQQKTIESLEARVAKLEQLMNAK